MIPTVENKYPGLARLDWEAVLPMHPNHYGSW